MGRHTEIQFDIAGDGLVPCAIEVVEDYAWVGDLDVGLRRYVLVEIIRWRTEMLNVYLHRRGR